MRIRNSKMKWFFLLATVSQAVVSSKLMAEEKSPWAHESEVSIIQVGGNSTSESYSAKQLTSYKFDQNILSLSARYLQSRSLGTETAKQWDGALRYERELNDKWSAFVQQSVESDTYSGYVQRDNTDLGGKYFFTKAETETFFAEAGVRNSKTNPSVGTEIKYATSGRIYLEHSKKMTESLSTKLWVEYLPSFKDSDAYLLNYEPSVSFMMNSIFSVKLAYLVKYHNKTANSIEKKEDTTFTTALVAKF